MFSNCGTHSPGGMLVVTRRGLHEQNSVMADVKSKNICTEGHLKNDDYSCLTLKKNGTKQYQNIPKSL